MAYGVGRTLHEARNRRELQLSEVEEAIRIRVRFLQAIEGEEWDALPGGVYTRGFIRTYASFLGLDGERLVDDYRSSVEAQGGRAGPGPELAPVAASGATGSPGGRRARPRLAWLVVPVVLGIAALVIVTLPDEDGDDGPPRQGAPAPAADTKRGASEPGAPSAGVSLSLAADAEVWVCLLDATGKPLVEGQVLEAGAEEGPFRSDSFIVSLGNGEIQMLIDGVKAEIPETASPIGFSIDSSGALTQLNEAERPTCT